MLKKIKVKGGIIVWMNPCTNETLGNQYQRKTKKQTKRRQR